jgi:hypothetical protein
MENMEEKQVKLWKRYGKYGRIVGWIVIRYGKIGKIQNKIVKWYGKCWRQVGWIVKWYWKYGRKVSWNVKWYGKYGIIGKLFQYISILKTERNPWQEDGWKRVIYRIPGIRQVIEKYQVNKHISVSSWRVWPSKKPGGLTCMDDVQLYRVHAYRNHPHGLSECLEGY